MSVTVRMPLESSTASAMDKFAGCVSIHTSNTVPGTEEIAVLWSAVPQTVLEGKEHLTVVSPELCYDIGRIEVFAVSCDEALGIGRQPCLKVTDN
jgi:hypothetical protein